MKFPTVFTSRFLALVFVSVFLNAAVVHSSEAAIQLVPVLQGLSSPVYVTSAHDGSQRLFVVEQPGRVQVLASGATAPSLFVDISPKVLFGGEQGLLGLAFHPQFASNSRFFVNYTRRSDGATVVAEYHASADPNVTAASEIVLLVIAQPFANHNGGMIEFGSDGFLYIGMGDGGSAFDPGNRAQDVNELLGKILRIDVDHPAGGNLYASPPGNPFAGATPGRDEIYALGVRNPFRFSFDRQTGQLYVGDVGQNVLEEVDIVTAGGNYGWRVYEGTQCTNVDPGLCTPTNFVGPIAQYDHSGGRCSIVGGYVYRGTRATLPVGTYVFGDFCSGEIFSLATGVPNQLLDTALSISSFGEDEAGEIYVVGLGGTVHRISSLSGAATTTTLTSSANPATLGASVAFTATVTGTTPTGSVSFAADAGPPITGCSAIGFTGGSGNLKTAICSTSSLAPGTHSIIANYGGDAGNAASSSLPLSQVINPVVSASASFLGTDTATQGNWKGRYGSDGYAILNDSTNYPAYAQVSASGKSDFVWAAQSDADVRTLQRGGAAGRIAACWYSDGGFSVDVNLTDQATHQLALYLLDWDGVNRVTRVDVLDAATQQVLATQTVQSYQAGVYLRFSVRGHVTLRFSNVSSLNAVLSGLFFDPATPPATYAVSGTVTAGGAALSGVNLTTTGALSCTPSDAAGHYTCSVPQGGSGTVTPALSGYTFTPPSRSYSNVAANQTAQDYVASPVVSAPPAWNTFAQDAQHTAQSTTASQPLNQIHWQTPVDLQPQYSGTSLLIHYGSPLITNANTVIVPVKTGATGGFRVEARGGNDGALKWSLPTDYILPPHAWTPVFGPALTAQPRLYFPGAGGTVYFRDQPDASAGASGQIAFYGLSNYQANPQAYDAGVMINTPIVSDSSGNIFFGFQTIGATPLALTSGIARINASGQGTWTSVTTAAADPTITKVVHNSAPALSRDLGTLYVAVSDGNAGYLVALNSTTLDPVARVRLKDPKSGQDARLPDDGSASPTVGPDDDVYFGVLGSPPLDNHFRGWLLHFDRSLSLAKIPGAFGWDDTASIVPAQIVPSYQGSSAYLLMTKYNNYTQAGGDGQNKLAVLDPNATQSDPVTLVSVMKEVLTIVGPTPETSGGVKEWCINSAAVDPLTRSILANSEDGKLYRWDLTTNTLSQSVVLTSGIGEAYTSTVIGVDGHVYAINNATLFAVGH